MPTREHRFGTKQYMFLFGDAYGSTVQKTPMTARGCLPQRERHIRLKFAIGTMLRSAIGFATA